MNAIIDAPAAAPASVPGLLLHCGAETVTRDQLAAVPTPRPTGTWFPLAHRDLVTEVECHLLTSGFLIKSMVHSLSHSGARYFGILQVGLPDRETTDYAWVVGLRNSHDKTYPAGMVAGTQVFVCDNLAFTGEVRLSRKHTRHASRDLRNLTARAVGKLGDRFHNLDRRIAAYRGKHTSDWAAHDLVIRAIDCGAITTKQVPHVLAEWRKPRHLQFEHRNAWSLFNAFTEAQKRTNPHHALPRGEALHGLFDAFCGVV
jgi:hypothetical protein